MRVSPSHLSKPHFFSSWQQIGVAISLLCLIFSASLLFQYQTYKRMTAFDDYTSTVWVENQYKKEKHWILKLQSDEGFSFYTTSREDLKHLTGYQLKIRLFTKGLDFISFLKGFYAPSVLLSRDQSKRERYMMMERLNEIHEGKALTLFKALFFASSIDKPLREQLSALGINHLLAISGFHLGVLGAILFMLSSLIYKPLQGRFFPYRSANRDISVFILIVLFVYLYFLDFVPSLLRAFGMSLFAFFLYDRGMKLFSFSSLFWVVMFLIAIWPKLLFSLGFWLSVAGVFYIFLFLHHMKELKHWQSFILLHLWIYLAMLPIIHVYFGVFSPYQLYSPLLSMLFILFYPLELFLHVIGEGGILDFVINDLLDIHIRTVKILLPLWILPLYIILSILAIFYRFFFVLIFFLMSGFLGHFLYRVTEF